MLVPLSLALLGAWVGTTLAIVADGPVWLAIVGAVVAFFVIPLVWELLADPDQRGGRLRDAILRSSFLSLVLLVGLIGTHPKTTFEALATRGDWFLGGARGEPADGVRRVLFTLADGLEWLNDWVRDKAFREGDQGSEVDPGAVASWARPKPGGTGASTQDTPTPQQEKPAPRVAAPPAMPIPGSSLTWPLPGGVERVVLEMPEEAKKSPSSVGKYLAEHVEDPFLRVKAVHDFVATWVRYDYAELRKPKRSAALQTAAQVFARRLGVCAGYARLAAAIGKAAKAEIIYLSGDARDPADYLGLAPDVPPPAGAGHAWNAARVNGSWYLFDATWDSDSPREDGSPGAYETTYLFVPPEVVILTHRPDADRWQLVTHPLSRGEWLRQPLMRPLAVRYGLVFAEPNRPRLDISDGTLRFAVTNPFNVHLQLGFASSGAAKTRICAKADDADATLSCPIPPGDWEANLFASATEEGPYAWVGGALVHAE